MRHAVLIGASGLTGSVLLSLLLKERHRPHIVLIGRTRINTDLSVEQHLLPDLTDTSALAALIPAGAWVFCCVGTTMAKAGSQEAFCQVDLAIPVALAQAAKQAGAEGITVVSSSGAKPGSFFFYTRIKGEMEQAVQAAGLPCTHIFRPGMLLGQRTAVRPGEVVGKVLFFLMRPFLHGPLVRYRAVKAERIARSMLCNARKAKRGLIVVEGRFGC